MGSPGRQRLRGVAVELDLLQVFSTALSIFATDTLLDTGSASPALGDQRRLPRRGGRSSYKTYDVGDDGSAIGLSNNTSSTLYQIVARPPERRGYPTADGRRTLQNLEIDDLFTGITNAGDHSTTPSRLRRSSDAVAGFAALLPADSLGALDDQRPHVVRHHDVTLDMVLRFQKASSMPKVMAISSILLE